MGLTQATTVALTIFVAGLIFHAGQLSQRLATVERDQNRLYEELRGIRLALERLVGAKSEREKQDD